MKILVEKLLQQMPHILVILWLMLIGFLVWHHVEQTEQPPLHDAHTYFLKAHQFWTKVDQGLFFNPLDLEPTARPPGTILMSYPFGFNSDYRPFYFRSVFLPLLCLVIAAYIAVYSPAMQNHERWNLSLLAIFLSTLPLFYQFEMPVGNDLPIYYYWGLVDNFLAGVAALATAALIRSIGSRSIGWLFVAVFISSFCILIKPAGILIIALVGCGCLSAIIFEIKPARTTAIKAIVSLVLIYLLFLGISFYSKYLSAENIIAGKAAIAVMKRELVLKPSLVNGMLSNTIGYAMLLLMGAIGLLACLYWMKPRSSSSPWRKSLLRRTIMAAALNLAVGVWFWIDGSGGKTEIRYFIPFVFMCIILMFPLTMDVMAKMQGKVKMVFCIFCLLPAINLILVMATPNPSVAWLRFTGINIVVGKSQSVTNQARAFLGEIERYGDNVTLYSMDTGRLDAVFTSVSDYTRAMDPSRPVYFTRRPVDWERPSVYRFHDILESEYILFAPMRDPQQRAQIFSQPMISNFEQESLLIRAWFTERTERDGLVVLSESPSARLLRIDDAEKLEASFYTMRDRYSWRNIFLEANPGVGVTLKRWWSRQETEHLDTDYPVELVNIHFGNVFKLHALSVSQSNNEISLHVWWERLQETPRKEWAFFIHSIDEKGTIIANNEIRIPHTKSPSRHHAIRLSSLVIPGIRDTTCQALAVGFYSGDTILQADSGVRDWENRRVIVSLRSRDE